MQIHPAPLLAGSFRVRRACRADVGPIAALLEADTLGSPEAPHPNLDTYRRTFEAIDADPAHFLAVVEDGAGTIAATAQLTLLPCLAAGAVTRLQVEAVHVRADLRSRGLGAALMDWALVQGRQNGAGLAQLTSNLRREDAHRFYRSLGFEPTHIGFKHHLTANPKETGTEQEDHNVPHNRNGEPERRDTDSPARQPGLPG
ncbi:GNAT family N-acetyltransferase [Arthrobacter sp. zg-Y750]|uniref:GNAT family N-acetyltransferase n=1 Tax=Arthrobacter sp. zg-Y750 TaxID=2894189 RepID=UPI001E42C87F|nr:GNAT family N-acetyltransferase [Arthrobacter sp. zg-Y750]MCC9178493.1 GNAT family N-acetyltransferase [Arthrobacter sp. zg-Y750]